MDLSRLTSERSNKLLKDSTNRQKQLTPVVELEKGLKMLRRRVIL
jgi:hypothetical protein